MSTEFLVGLKRFMASGAAAYLSNSRRGIEKESLRVRSDGRLSSHSHPSGLGAALTHPYITTDYSEAQLELITPTSDSLDGVLTFLTDLHRYVFRHIGDELMWVNSMPCVIDSEASIPIARYGQSMLGRLKHIYRQGLSHRYGRAMQAISGVHFNYSFTDEFWSCFAQSGVFAGPEEWSSLLGAKHLLGGGEPSVDEPLLALQRVKNAGYFAIIRNFMRINWWLVLVFGASPAVCNSFFQGRQHQLLIPDNHTALGPYATSLRMGDLGYQNSRQKSLSVCHNSVEAYARSLQRAMRMPDEDFAAIGLCVDGEYRQLSTNVLQIENEYYGSIRPKRTVKGLERPSDALLRLGVEYLEVRLLDLDPFESVGVSREQLQVIEVLLLYCLLCDSPLLTDSEYADTRKRMNQVVNRGRDPNEKLSFAGKTDCIQTQALRLLDDLNAVAEAAGIADWAQTEKRMRQRLEDFDQLPSARILAELSESQRSYFDWAVQRAEATADVFRNSPIDPARLRQFEAATRASVSDQELLERDHKDFAPFLAEFLGFDPTLAPSQ
ncbi:MAG: glutamate--cysteine ligase [Gammaproteobacteria bacterium]